MLESSENILTIKIIKKHSDLIKLNFLNGLRKLAVSQERLFNNFLSYCHAESVSNYSNNVKGTLSA